MFGKIKKVLFQKKVLILVLAALAAVGWVFAIFFGIKLNNKVSSSECMEKLAKVNAYSSILDQSNKLARSEKSLSTLEDQIRDLGNGSLFAVWQNAVSGGNKEQDLNDYFDTLVDSINFFSK